MKFLEFFLIFVVVYSCDHLVKGEDCDKYGVLFYEDIACKPIKPEGKSCPTKFDCNFSRPKSGCIFKGRAYFDGEEINSTLTYSACSIGCRCNELNTIICAVLDCPEFFGHGREPGCYNTYELEKCCSTGKICEQDAIDKKCEVDGKTYDVGQKFYPKNTCLSCICHKDFNGKFDEKTCVRRNCAAELHDKSRINEGCAPVYFDYGNDKDTKDNVLCCPDDWICPDTSDRIKMVNEDAKENSELECTYGEKKLKLGEGLEKKMNQFGKDRNIKCECMLPPLLTCREIYLEA